MNILKISIDGLPRYRQPLVISFLANQRVQENHVEMVTNLFGNIYVNNAMAFIGINASGKTTALNALVYAFKMMNSTPLNDKSLPDILSGGKETVFDIHFYANNAIYRLQSKILKAKNEDGVPHTRILSETLYSKKIDSTISKSNVLNDTGFKLIRERGDVQEGGYLPDDISIIIALNKQNNDKIKFINLTSLTNYNLLNPNLDTIPADIISLLDPTIEYINLKRINGNVIYNLKFRNQDEISDIKTEELEFYLSSGTIKGISVFSASVQSLLSGGYLFIDEIENHFNHELVAELLRLFLDKRTNPKGATIVFTTHYSELLDELTRNDSVYITRSAGGLIVDRLDSLLERNDLRKSEIYQSNFLGGTAPKYRAIVALQDKIEELFKNGSKSN